MLWFRDRLITRARVLRLISRNRAAACCDDQEKVGKKLSLFPPFLVFNYNSYSSGLL